MQTRSQDDDKFGVVCSHAVIFNNARFNVAVYKKSEDAKGCVGNNADVYFSMVTYAATVDRVDVCAFPKLVQFNIFIYILYKLLLPYAVKQSLL